MRARLVILVLAILLVAGFAALNWAEVVRTSPLNFGLFVMDAPLGGILLSLLGLGLVLYLISSGLLRSRMMITENRYTRDLQVQRDLADKAEASRFTELRQYLDTHFRENRQRDTVVSTEFEKNMLQGQRELRAQLEQMNRMLAARLGEPDGLRSEPATPAVDDAAVRPVDVPPRDRVKL